MTKQRAEVNRLDVRVRRVATGDGEVTREMTVFCPPRATSLALDECNACDHCAGVSLDPSERHSFLMCRGAVPPRPHPDSRRAASGSTTVGAIMSQRVICVGPDVSVEALLALLLDNGISGVPVVDAAGRPIGVVTKTDLLREQRDGGSNDGDPDLQPLRVRRSGYVVELGEGFHAEDLASATVRDIMTPTSFTLTEIAPIGQAAALMAFEGVHRVPVVDSAGAVVGIISALDIARWVAHQDGYVV